MKASFNDLLLASGNKHKAEELSELLHPLVVVSAPEGLDIAETGSSFYENAFLKAEGYFKKYQRPTLSDDSGLVVAALPGELGIHSARFGGEGLTDWQRCELLLEKMADEKERSAYFVCVLCLYLSPTEVFYFEGRVQGSIGMTPAGEQGFGYDPLFYPEKNSPKSFAEDKLWKQGHSHRALACLELGKFFQR
jgi:XTP/dITP diphosphohydrolase